MIRICTLVVFLLALSYLAALREQWKRKLMVGATFRLSYERHPVVDICDLGVHA
jgi:hypothetical protein